MNLKFSPEFHNSWVMGMTYNVRFGINRSVFSFMHVRPRQDRWVWISMNVWILDSAIIDSAWKTHACQTKTALSNLQA